MAVPEAKGVKPEYLATLSVNPASALRMIEDFETLKAGPFSSLTAPLTSAHFTSPLFFLLIFFSPPCRRRYHSERRQLHGRSLCDPDCRCPWNQDH